jgi:hypothetical protein
VTFPPVQDLAVEPEPALPVEALSDPDVEDEWNDDVLLWGRDGWRQVGRLCRFFRGHGMEIDCPTAE